MHTADGYGNKIYVFKGGNGKEYCNDLYELDTSTLIWKKIVDNFGTGPQKRANHSSSIVKDNLFIFGG